MAKCDVCGKEAPLDNIVWYHEWGVGGISMQQS